MRPSADNLVHVIDILLVSYLLYRLFMLVRSTRAWRILTGIIIFVALLFLSDFLQLRTLHWLLEKATLLGPVALAILFLPELRQALEGFAKIRLISDGALGRVSPIAEARTIEEIVGAATELAASRIGMLIVIELRDALDEVAANGVNIDAEVSAALLGSIFYTNNPLHDGAVVIRGNRVRAAACRLPRKSPAPKRSVCCRLPLSEATYVDKHVHMRHRAGLGISEQTDALAVMVSEERGTISIAREGSLTKLNDPNELRTILNSILRGSDETGKGRGRRRRDKQEVAV
jgi:diadenylate cyclase